MLVELVGVCGWIASCGVGAAQCDLINDIRRFLTLWPPSEERENSAPSFSIVVVAKAPYRLGQGLAD